MKYDVFISYRRSDGEYTAKMLRDKLMEQGYTVFFDVEALRSGDFNTELYSVIENCKDFVIVLSPDALKRCENDSDWVRKEIEHALKLNKNIVPILLRGFEFPEKLPESIEPLRYKNGLEANTQFFDAFIEKLSEFFISKPSLFTSIFNSKLFRKALPLFFAVSLVAIISFGIFLGVQSLKAEYPRTESEKNITGEVLYCVSSNLTVHDIIGGATIDAFDAAQRFISTGSKDRNNFRNALELARQTIENVDLSRCDAQPDFITRLQSTPFAVEDVIAMCDLTLSFRNNNLGYLDYIEYITSEDIYLQDSLKLEILDCYRNIFDEYLLTDAYCANELLLPVTNSDVIEEFISESLTGLTTVPLSASGWLDSDIVLKNEIDASYERAESVINDLSVLLGNINIENEVLRRSLIDKYVYLGYTVGESEKIIEDSLAAEDILNKICREYKLQPTDDADTIWWKMMVFLSFGLYDEALECADMFGIAAVETEPYLQEFLPSLRSLISRAEVIGIDYGVIVTGYVDSDNKNEKLNIGDIIIGFDGQVCHTLNEYSQLKNSLEADNYTLTVLRNDGVSFSIENLGMTTDMPSVYLAGISY